MSECILQNRKGYGQRKWTAHPEWTEKYDEMVKRNPINGEFN